MKSVSVILNGFKRPHTLKLQYEAVMAQSVKPKEVLLWKTNQEGYQFDYNSLDNLEVTENTKDFGIWGRFVHALNSSSEYICIIDDDTIPQMNYFQSCIECIENVENGLYGPYGIIFHDAEYQNVSRFGWVSPNNEIKKVDFVGHSWFFHRDLLGAFWREAGNVPDFLKRFGDDVYFAYAIQKYLNLSCFVPPHPMTDGSLWGSHPQLGYKLGVDDVAISTDPTRGPRFKEVLQYCIKNGFRPIEYDKFTKRIDSI